MARSFIASFFVFLSAFGVRAEERLPLVHGRPAYVLDDGATSVFVTQTGGHMTAAFAGAEGRKIAPYHVSPWQEESDEISPPILAVLRGDFFCLPFGANAARFRGERHPPHGETANAQWTLVDRKAGEGRTSLTLALDTRVRPGRVTKRLTLVAGHSVVYSTHVIEGFSGPAPLGHHATLAVPETEGALRTATSPIRFGITNPTPFSDQAKGEYQSLAVGVRFTDPRRVPQIFKDAPDADVTRFPARRGYADFFLLVNDLAATADGPAWSTAVNVEAGYLWFALKDPRVLPVTAVWIENRGRHAAPWKGRNHCLGLEDVCSYFADGVAPSAARNLLLEEGVPTVVDLRADRPTSVHYIQGAVPVPAGFDVVRGVEFAPGAAAFTSASGLKVTVAVKHEFVRDGKL